MDQITRKTRSKDGKEYTDGTLTVQKWGRTRCKDDIKRDKS